jgi:predicted Zn finger-like uncharacterized protein
MIITCASCLTKFNLDDSRISAGGVKVRCSRCKHVFYVVPPPETKEEIIENLESFSKYHEDLMGPGEKKVEAVPDAKLREGEEAPEREEKEEEGEGEEEGGEEAFLFTEKAPTEKVEESVPSEKLENLFDEEPGRQERREGKPSKPMSMMRVERRGPLRFLALLIVLMLLIFGIFYLWSELSSGGRLSSYVEYPIKKSSELWNQIWGTEGEDLVVGDLSGYDEKIGDVPLFVIEGKVKNQSKFTKKYIKIKIVIFDQDKIKVAEKEAICGRTIGRGELNQQPARFFEEEMVVKPQTEEEMVTPPGKAAPFMVIFKDLPSQAKDFKSEIVEAPNL